MLDEKAPYLKDVEEFDSDDDNAASAFARLRMHNEEENGTNKRGEEQDEGDEGDATKVFEVQPDSAFIKLLNFEPYYEADAAVSTSVHSTLSSLAFRI